MLDGINVSVHRIKPTSFERENELDYKLSKLTRARQENLVFLLGVCLEGGHRLLGYEHVCNGSVEQHLSGLNIRLTFQAEEHDFPETSNLWKHVQALVFNCACSKSPFIMNHS